MGWILCRASVSVVGLSARAGHSSGVVPLPGVEDDSLREREEAGAGYCQATTDTVGRLAGQQAPVQDRPGGMATATAAPPSRAGPTRPRLSPPWGATG